MPGINAYFSHETGTVSDVKWVIDEDVCKFFYEMYLEDNPHRKYAFDYDSDIGIDPLIKRGDEVIYIRINNYSGIWVEKSHATNSEIDKAKKRVIENRKFIHEFREISENNPEEIKEWLESIYEKTGIKVHRYKEDLAEDEAPSDSSMPEALSASVFISYSSKNIMLAKEFVEKIQGAHKKAWIDIEQMERSSDHEYIKRTLKSAITGCQIFVLLLSKTANDSYWVNEEIDVARQQAQDRSDFHLIVLKIEDISVPEAIRDTEYLIDCKGLSMGEIIEELYSAVYKRLGRQKWITKQDYFISDNTKRRRLGGYSHLRSDSGEAIALNWTRKGNRIHWVLDYISNGKERRVEGNTEDEVVDLGISPNDKIGFFLFNQKIPVWMRSEEKLDISPHIVVQDYLEKFRPPPPKEPYFRNALLIIGGFLIILLIFLLFFH